MDRFNMIESTTEHQWARQYTGGTGFEPGVWWMRGSFHDSLAAAEAEPVIDKYGRDDRWEATRIVRISTTVDTYVVESSWIQ